MNKEKIRKEILKERGSYSEEEIKGKSDKIFGFLRDSKLYKNAQKIMVYLSFGGEVDTIPFVETALSEGKEIFVPKIQKDYKMKALKITDFNNLQKNKMGILEPVLEIVADKSKIDLFVVPGIAFDKKFNRIGFGKGYYDRFLENTEGFKVGVAFEFQIVQQIKTHEFDIPMDGLITERGWY